MGPFHEIKWSVPWNKILLVAGGGILVSSLDLKPPLGWNTTWSQSALSSVYLRSHPELNVAVCRAKKKALRSFQDFQNKQKLCSFDFEFITTGWNWPFPCILHLPYITIPNLGCLLCSSSAIWEEDQPLRTSIQKLWSLLDYPNSSGRKSKSG